MTVEYIDNCLSAVDIIRFQHMMGWTEDPIEQWEKALRNTLFSVVAVKSGEIIGMGRLLGDAAIYWYINDVFISTECQRLGIGTKIVKRLIQHAKESSISGTPISICLMCAQGKRSFMKSWGFDAVPMNLRAQEWSWR